MIKFPRTFHPQKMNNSKFIILADIVLDCIGFINVIFNVKMYGRIYHS